MSTGGKRTCQGAAPGYAWDIKGSYHPLAGSLAGSLQVQARALWQAVKQRSILLPAAFVFLWQAQRTSCPLCFLCSPVPHAITLPPFPDTRPGSMHGCSAGACMPADFSSGSRKIARLCKRT